MDKSYEKITTELLCYIEEKGKKKDFNKLNSLLNKGVSEDDLECISFFLYETANEVFTSDFTKKNTIKLFKILYKKYIKRIVQNLGDSEHRYDLVDYIIKIISDNIDYCGNRENLFDVITYAFDNLKFNECLAKNIDFKRISQDEEYAKKVEDIVVLMEEYNHYIRFYNDAELQEDRNYGMKRIFKYIDAREKKDPNFYNNSMLFDYLLLHVCERYSQGKEAEPKVFEYVKKCVDSRTKSETFNLYTDQGISDLFQIINCSKISLDQVKELSDIIYKNLRIDEIDKDKAYEQAQKIMEKSGLDDNELIELFGKVQAIRLASKNQIPDDIIDYLMFELLNKESALNKNSSSYRRYICRIFESFAVSQLPPKMKEKYVYFFREFIDAIDSDGCQVGKVVFLNEELVSKSMETINTIFHENTHIEQEYNYKNDSSCSYPEYMALKENILCQTIPGFQVNNYNFLFLEINAREKANLKMLKYFLNSRRLKKIVSKQEISSLIHGYKTESSQYVGAFSKIEDGKTDNEKDINVLFGEILKKEWLEEYPILSLEYNDDCSLKTPEQIIKEIESTNDRKKIILLINILKNNNIFRPENVYRDALYLINYSTDNKRLEKTLSHLVASTFIKVLYSQYENFDNLDLEQRKQFCEIIGKAQKKIEEQPDSAFSKGILQTNNKTEGTVIKTFELIRKYVETKEPTLLMVQEGEQK